VIVPSIPASIKLTVIVTAVAFSLSGCGKQQNQAAWWAGEQERMELTHQVELQKFRYDQVYTGDFSELEKFQAKSRAASARAVSLLRGQAELSSEVDSLQSQWPQFRESTLGSQRQRAMHKTFETLRLASGRKFDKATVSSIDDAGVTIRHAVGSARLRFTDLNARERVFFGLEADLALAAHEKETRETVAYELWVAKRMESIRLSEVAMASDAHRREPSSPGKSSDSHAPQVVALNVRLLRQPAKSIGSSSYGGYRYSSYPSYYPTYRYIYNQVPSCSGHFAGCIGVYPPLRYPVVSIGQPTNTSQHSSFADTTIP
jgi:hypothetical protein